MGTVRGANGRIMVPLGRSTVDLLPSEGKYGPDRGMFSVAYLDTYSHYLGGVTTTTGITGGVDFRADHRAFTILALTTKKSVCAINGLLKRADVGSARICTSMMVRAGIRTVDQVSDCFSRWYSEYW